MSASMHIDLAGRVEGTADIGFDRLEWWTPKSRFILLRYTRHGEMPEFGIRIDVDKRVVLDILEQDLERALTKEKVAQICDIFIDERAIPDVRDDPFFRSLFDRMAAPYMVDLIVGLAGSFDVGIDSGHIDIMKKVDCKALQTLLVDMAVSKDIKGCLDAFLSSAGKTA